MTSAAKASDPKPKNRKHSPCLYLGCFFFDEPGETDWAGTFQIVVEATSPLEAVALFEQRIRQLRKTTTLLRSPITVYIEGLIKLCGSYKDGLLVNWLSRRTLPPHGELSCLIPEQKDHDAVGFEYIPKPRPGKKSSKQKDEGEETEPFLDFGGRKYFEERAKRTEPGLSHESAPPDSLQRGAEHRKAQAQAKKEAAALARAQAQAKRERRAALQSTLDELGTSSPRPK